METKSKGDLKLRLAEEKAYLDRLDLERMQRGDQTFGKTVEQRLIWRELLELELQEAEEQMKRIRWESTVSHTADSVRNSPKPKE